MRPKAKALGYLVVPVPCLRKLLGRWFGEGCGDFVEIVFGAVDADEGWETFAVVVVDVDGFDEAFGLDDEVDGGRVGFGFDDGVVQGVGADHEVGFGGRPGDEGEDVAVDGEDFLARG